MKKPTIKHPAATAPDTKPKHRPFFLDDIFTKYRKYRNYKRYIHGDLL